MLTKDEIIKRLELMYFDIGYTSPVILDNLYVTNVLFSDEFMRAPASTKYHGSYPGGLIEHSLNVADTLCRLTRDNNLKWERCDSPVIIGLFHDICKMDQYKSNYTSAVYYENEVAVRLQDPQQPYTFNNETLLKGHGDKSIMMLASITQLTEEEVACIRYHMGAFTDKEEWKDYTRAIHKYPNVLWTHHADMIATHIIEVDKEDKIGE